MLVVAQQNGCASAEFGVIEIEPGEVCVIPRGVIFRASRSRTRARLVCENYGGGFTLRSGPIGANCLPTRATSSRRLRHMRMWMRRTR